MRSRASILHSAFSDATVRRLRVREALSEPFEIEALVEIEDPDLALDSLIFSTAAFELVDLDGHAPSRVWHGVIESATYVHSRDRRHVYRVLARPRLCGLAYRFRSRIFQEKDVLTIVKEVLTDAGVDKGLAVQASGSHPVRPYCVQYQESELAFVSRLLEEEGIYYWFDHKADGHSLVIADQPDADFKPLEGGEAIAFSKWEQADRESVGDLLFQARLVHDAYAARDWNFESPEEPLTAAEAESDASVFERYEYPGGFSTNDDGGVLACMRYQEAQARKYELSGRSNFPRLRPARHIVVRDAVPAAVSQKWLLLAVDHLYEDLPRAPGDEASGGAKYVASFRAMSAQQTYRPPRRTPRPRVSGRDGAVVTGPAGEEIHVDELARIKVHFYWDREGKIDDTATAWVRVQQQNTFGSMLLPRVGWELEIAYEGGDPDRPVALQKLYNRETLPPYGLPAGITKTSLQSTTSPGGGGTNEIRMEDGAGGMELFVHASKDLAVDCRHDLTEQIAVDSSESVGVDFKTTIIGSESITVGASQSYSVTGATVDQTTGARSETVGAMDDWGIKKNLALTTQGSRSETIGGLMNVVTNKLAETFNANLSRTVGAAQAINSVKAITESVGGNKTENVGAAKMEIVTKAKSENVGIAKALTSGIVSIKTGKDIAVTAKAAMSIMAGGVISENIKGNLTIGAKSVTLTGAGGISMKGGGTKWKLSGSTLTIDASSFGASGGPKIVLKGKINYQDP